MQGSGSDRVPPEYWQTRVDKVRAIADEMFDLRSRETLLRIAKDYGGKSRTQKSHFFSGLASAYRPRRSNKKSDHNSAQSRARFASSRRSSALRPHAKLVCSGAWPRCTVGDAKQAASYTCRPSTP
jgi:hypothetical protein